MFVNIDNREYDMNYARNVRDTLSQKDLSFFKRLPAARAMNMTHIHLLIQHDQKLCWELRDEVHRLLTPIHDLDMFQSWTSTWRERGFGCFYSCGSTLEENKVLIKEYDSKGVQHRLNKETYKSFIDYEYPDFDRFIELVYKFDPNNKEKEQVMTEEIKTERNKN